MELSLPPCRPSRLATARRTSVPTVAWPEKPPTMSSWPQRGDDQRHPVRVTPGQTVRVMVRVNDDVIQASVLDHGPDLPAQPPSDADTDALAAGGRVCGCCAG
jgi:hypothetical protein